MKFFFLLPFHVNKTQTKIALVGVKSQKKATLIKKKFAKSFTKSFIDHLKVSVIPGFNTPEDVVEIDGYTKLHTIEILRESFDKKTMNDEMHMIQALNHSIFQLQNKLQKHTKKSL